jgi:hypothetical protein
MACVLLSLPSVSEAGWYSMQGESPTKIRVEVESKAMQLPVRKIDLPVTALGLRRDTERPDYYWVEVALPETRDSDRHLLVIAGRSVGQVFTRANKWAIGFSSLAQARRCFDYLQKFHQLDPKHARDATKP